MPAPAASRSLYGPVATVLKLLLPLLLAIAVAIAGSAAGRRDRLRDKCNKTVDINDDVSTPLVTQETRGRPMLCWYQFRVNPQRLDWIISIRFYRFKVGRLANASVCLDGYVQISDGGESGVRNPGYFCGEVDRPQTYISESSHVKVTFYAQSFSEGTYIAFNSRSEQQFELYSRYGPNPQLYPDRRGRLEPNTLCDRQLHDCRLGTCYVQSPAYPGVYPRNLRCQYHVATSTGSVKLYIENEEINVDGQRCEDVILCPNRPVMTQCPYDSISVYDGPTERSPFIGSFCGRGKLPYAITGSGRHLLIVFVSSSAGPFLNTGFHFNVGHVERKWVGHGAAKINGSCDAVFHRDAETPVEERRFYSLSTWYAPHTTCSFTIWGWENEIIRLDFRSFRIRRPDSAILDERGCVETLTIYDAPFADESRLLAMFCDSWSPLLPAGQDFVSSGNAMFVQFRSEVGSYAGSSLDYWVQFDFFNAYTHGVPVPNTECDERFPSAGHSSGVFSSPLNSLLFTRRTRLECAYSFSATAFPYERVLVTLSSVNFSASGRRPCSDCVNDAVDKILVRDMESMENPTCICGSRFMSNRIPMRVLSTGPALEVRLSVERSHVISPLQQTSFPETLLFQGTYEYLHGPRCGPHILDSRHQGELVFPQEPEVPTDTSHDGALVRCVWSLIVHPNKSLFLRFDQLHLPGDCGNDRLEIKVPLRAREYVDNSHVVICGGVPSLEDLPLVTDTMLRGAGRVLVELRTVRGLDASFRLVWTELVPMATPSHAHAELRAADGCAFVCGGSNACIPHELVCNGVRNCPLVAGAEDGADEAVALCRRDSDAVNWLAIGLGAAGGGVLAACCILLVHRCCRKVQETDPG